MKKQTKIIIADDHEVWRKGMVEVLHSINGLQVVAECGDGLELLKLCSKWHPDLVITDLKMPLMDGSNAIKEMINNEPSPVIIAMSMVEEEMEIYDVLASGAKGYLVKNAKRYEIKSAVEAVMNSDSYYCRFQNMRLATLLKENRYPNLPVHHKQFTEREKEVLEGMSRQLTSEEIAEKLFISPMTVNGHRNNLLKKTGSRNVIGVILYAIKNRLIKWPDNDSSG